MRTAAVRIAVAWALEGKSFDPAIAGATAAATLGIDRDAPRGFIEGHDEARQGAARIGAALDSVVPTLLSSGGESFGYDPLAKLGTERVSVVNVAMKDGAPLAVCGREFRGDWLANPEKTAANVGSCSSTWGVMRTASGYVPHPYCCTSGLCPVCARNKAATQVRRWTEPVMALAKAGCTLVHLTLTQPQYEGMNDDDVPVYLTPWERERGMFLVRSELRPYPFNPSRMEQHFSAVPGEALLDNRDRLYRSWRTLRNGTRHRPQWRRSVFAAVHGIESTGRVYDHERGGFRLRWHSHLHAMVVLYPGVDAAEWFADIAERWRGVTEAVMMTGQSASIEPVKVTGETTERGAQCMRTLNTRDPEELRRSLVETLKYPVKLGQLTDAQLVEYLAACKGSKNHWATAAFHATDKRGKVARMYRDEVPPDEIDTAAMKLPIRDRALCETLGRALAKDEEGGAEIIYEAAHPGDTNAVPASDDGSNWKILTVPALARHVAAGEDLLVIRGYGRPNDADAPLGPSARQERACSWSPPLGVYASELLGELTTWVPRSGVSPP